MTQTLSATTFHRHNRPLRTFLLESEIWFCARDLGRLMGWPLNERTTRKLDADQRRIFTLVDSEGEEETLAIGESAVYALLTYHYHGENRALCRWITHEVAAFLRNERAPFAACNPCLIFLQYSRLSMNLVQWQGKPWSWLQDMPQVLVFTDNRGIVRRDVSHRGGSLQQECWEDVKQAALLRFRTSLALQLSDITRQRHTSRFV